MKKATPPPLVSMPKIAVDEDYQITLWKNQIRLSFDFRSFSSNLKSSLFDGGLGTAIRHCFCDLTFRMIADICDFVLLDGTI